MAGEIIIIGAGAAGLAAGINLCEKGFHVTILEGRDRAGGRIFTFNGNGFSVPVEAGAEFIHGELEVTLSLMKKYKLDYTKTKGRWYSVKNGDVQHSPPFLEQHK